MFKKFSIIFYVVFSVCACTTSDHSSNKIKCYSGIYPHLAYYNSEETECGTGTVVSWADRLWVISYGAANPYGSSDKLYEITPELEIKTRSESIGGTHANRMIHRESNQLFIGPYVIDKDRNVRTISSSKMPGRITGNARHLYFPTDKIYFAAMEEGLYEVDVNTLEITTLYKDISLVTHKKKDLWPHVSFSDLLGEHGKGLYSGQGVLVYSNNGEPGDEALENFNIEAGSLYEWDSKNWKLIRRNQFTEVTGPGGIWGNENPDTDPIWSIGWDAKSIIVGVREPKIGWSFYRLPKASHSYDGAHGWNTEWPRIRNIGTPENPDYLMTMHGMFWRFPKDFSLSNSFGIRPRSSYLKVIGDFTRWNDRLVFGCDDSAENEFLNTRQVKDTISGAGQSNSNLWFTPLNLVDQLGTTNASGALWISEHIQANIKSEPFLFSGWDYRTVWIKNEGKHPVTFSFEIDEKGNNSWTDFYKVIVPPSETMLIDFTTNKQAEWIRANVNQNTKATVIFNLSQKDKRSNSTNPIFQGLANVSQNESKGGLLWSLRNNNRKLGVLVGNVSTNSFTETGYYELDSNMNLVKKEDENTAAHIRTRVAIPKQVLTIDNASVLVVDDKGRKWRLPVNNHQYKELTDNTLTRLCREVVTERDLFNCAGTFYELPAENADGFAKIRPIASHNFRIHDYTSFQGLLVMTGIDKGKIKNNKHIITSADGKASVWVGAIDDLWSLGKPVGEGGAWKNSKVIKNIPSDPYLIGFYDKRTLTLTHNKQEQVTFTIEVEPIGHGPWMEYKKITVNPAETITYVFPNSFQSRWIRFVANKDCQATAWLKYE